MADKMDIRLSIFNGKYTIQNRTTGEHRTFMVKTQAEDAKFAPGTRVVALLTGSDNDSDASYQGFGFVNLDGIRVWSSKRGTPDGKKSAWEWYAEMLWSLAVDAGHSEYADRYTLLMEGRCVKCNRVLTEPESIRTGIGPVCAGREGKE